MSPFSKLFGSPKTSAPTELLNFDIRQDWFVSNADLKKVSDYLSAHPALRLTQAHDQMDDYNVLTLALYASTIECADLKQVPKLIFRAEKKGLTVIFESYIFFEERFFSSRGKNSSVRLRFDSSEVVVCDENEISYSTDKSSVFFERLDLFKNSISAEIVRVQIVPERGNPSLATFDFVGARPVFAVFAEAICGPEYQKILTINSQIIDTVLRMGPKYMLACKKALAALRFDAGPIDYSKTVKVFSAIQGYAAARHACEIYGFFNPNSTKPNSSWSINLYNEMPTTIRNEMGSLKLFD